MKTGHLVCSLMLLVLLGLAAGCAGYGTTLFMTKSNAGLDIDMEPPTTEINISRKEALVTPTFEKGQTLPAMASFKPNVHFGGALGNFVFGVDQTFAGGDAALTMASLYDAPTPPRCESLKYDSTLYLDRPVTNTCRCAIPPVPPGKTKPFIFGTDTSLGLKVAWSGAGGQFPDTLKAGFNRKEFAWAPITFGTNNGSNSVKMPSFLATIESSIGSGSTTNRIIGTNVPSQRGGIQSIQYFATGEAATRLALQKEVRDAMLKRLDPRYGTSAPRIGKGPVARQLLSAMETALGQLKGDEVAKAHYQCLQNLKGVQIPSSFASTPPPMLYYTRPVSNIFEVIEAKEVRSQTNVCLADVTTYMVNLESSVAAMETIKASYTASTNALIYLKNGSTNQLNLAGATEIGEQLRIQEGEYGRVQKELSADKDVSAAYTYFQSLTAP